MTQFNPFVGAILQSTVVQRQQSAEKSSQIRKAQQLLRNVAAEDEQLEEQVESAQEIGRTREQRDGDEHPDQRHSPAADADSSEDHLDLTA